MVARKRNKLAAAPAPSLPFVPSAVAQALAPIKTNQVRVGWDFFPNGPDPDAYAMELQGTCLEPEVFNGDMAICSPAAPIKRGEFVALWFVDPAQQPMLKRLVLPPGLPVGTPVHPMSEADFPVIVEMLNPPRRFAIRISKLRAMHAVVGIYRERELSNVRIAASHDAEGELA